MKWRVYFATLLVVFIIASGCSSDEGEEPGVGFFPRIKEHLAYNVNDPENPLYVESFHPGDAMSISIIAEDLDLNMITLTGTVSYETDYSVPLGDPVEIPLPPQDKASMVYMNIFPVAVQGPAGQYRVTLVIEDAGGNRSIPYTAGFIVEDE